MTKVIVERIHKDAKLPMFGRNGDAGADVTAVGIEYSKEKDLLIYHTGIKLQIPDGHEVQVRPRSSIGSKDIFIHNSPGTIDSNYRGEIMILFKCLWDYDDAILIDDVFNTYDEPRGREIEAKIYAVGDKVAQLVLKKLEPTEYEEGVVDPNTNRGENGFGSSDK